RPNARRGAIEAVVRSSRATGIENRKSHQAFLEPARQRFAVEVLTDENEQVVALAAVPRAVELRVEEHVHALEDEALLRALHAEHALRSVEVIALGSEELADPGIQLLRVQVAGALDTDRRHFLVVRVLVREIVLP